MDVVFGECVWGTVPGFFGRSYLPLQGSNTPSLRKLRATPLSERGIIAAALIVWAEIEIRQGTTPSLRATSLRRDGNYGFWFALGIIGVTCLGVLLCGVRMGLF